MEQADNVNILSHRVKGMFILPHNNSESCPLHRIISTELTQNSAVLELKMMAWNPM